MKNYLLIAMVSLIITAAIVFCEIFLFEAIQKQQAIQSLQKCQEYETSGTLSKGSCKCAQQLYPDFSKSYDWMDACYVLEKSH